MNEELLGLLGATPEQIAQARRQSGFEELGLLGQALMQAGAPAPRGTSTLSRLGQAAGMYTQAPRQTMDTLLQDLLRRQQVQDMQRKRQREESYRRALEGARTTRVSPTLGLGAAQVESPITQAEIEAFGPQAYMDAARTVAPTETFIDRNKMLEAISQVDPMKYLELTKPTEAPSEIRTLQTLLDNPRLLEGYLQIEGAKAPRTTNVFNENKAEQVLFEKVTAPRIQGFVSSAESARQFARTASTINNLLKGKGGGDAVKIGTELAGAIGIKSEQVTAQDLANSLVVQLAPRMRAPGSGSTSDIEFKSYISAVPSLSNSEPGREIMTKYAEAFATRSGKLADHAEKLAKQGKLSFEAMEEYDRSLGPLLKQDFYDAVQGAKPRGVSGSVLDFRGGQ